MCVCIYIYLVKLEIAWSFKFTYSCYKNNFYLLEINPSWSLCCSSVVLETSPNVESKHTHQSLWSLSLAEWSSSICLCHATIKKKNQQYCSIISYYIILFIVNFCINIYFSTTASNNIQLLSVRFWNILKFYTWHEDFSCPILILAPVMNLGLIYFCGQLESFVLRTVLTSRP